jgi:clan AA aspartic protease (TIGR02281 family)
VPGVVIAFLTVLWLLVHAGASGAAEYYRWVDARGVVHFTDNLHNIPETQRGSVLRMRTTEMPKPADPPPVTAAVKASVPIERRGEVMVIEATFNKKRPAKLVVDTGSSYTMISSALARDLQIDPSRDPRTIPFQTANGMIEAPLTQLESITVGGMEIPNLTAAIHDAVPDPQIAGLLGLNFLSNFRMDIDTQKGLLHLERKQASPPPRKEY